MAKPLVSAIIAVYNDPVRLPRSVDSIRAQSFTNWEIVIANDGSSDETLAVATGLAASDPRIRVLDLPHGGAASARNAAARAARGEWLAIQDSDDYSAPARFERQLALLREQPTLGVVASYGERVSEDRVYGVVAMGPTSIEEFRRQRAHQPTYVINGTAMIHRETFLAAGGYPEDYRVAEDLALYSLGMAPRCDILVIPEPLVFIEMRRDSLSRAFAEEIVQGDDIIRLNLERRARGQPPLDYEKALREMDRASLLGSLRRRRRGWRHAWFARGAADLSARSVRGLPPLVGALAIAPIWTVGRVLPRLAAIGASTRERKPPLNPKFLYRGAYRLLKPVSHVFRARTRRRGVDCTATLGAGSALILAPHPDDETLGCAATIMRKRDAGYPVHVIIATDGANSHAEQVIPVAELRRIRRGEALEAARLLGLGSQDVTFLELPDGSLPRARDGLVSAIATAVSDLAPEQVFVSSSIDAHPDHVALAEAARSALGRAGFEGALYQYPIWYWERLPWTHRPSNLAAAAWHFVRDPVAELLRPRAHLVEIGPYLERKRAAVAAHRSQVTPVTGGSGGALLPAEFVEHFLQRHEVFFPVKPRGVHDAAVLSRRRAANEHASGRVR